MRDIASRFADANAQVLGVSTDDIDTQTRFATSLKLPFPLLADTGGAVARRYGVYRPTVGLATTAPWAPPPRTIDATGVAARRPPTLRAHRERNFPSTRISEAFAAMPQFFFAAV